MQINMARVCLHKCMSYDLMGHSEYLSKAKFFLKLRKFSVWDIDREMLTNIGPMD